MLKMDRCITIIIIIITEGIYRTLSATQSTLQPFFLLPFKKVRNASIHSYNHIPPPPPHTHTQKHTNSNKLITTPHHVKHDETHAYTHKHTYKRMHTHTGTHTHTHMRIHMHGHTHTHTHTYTHTHINRVFFLENQLSSHASIQQAPWGP